MRSNKVLPGVLPVFRWLVSARLLLLLLGLVLKWLPGEPRTLHYPLPAIIESALLLGYLSWPWLRAHLGRAYLPPALLVASTGPIFESMLTVVLRVRAGIAPTAATQDQWVLIFVLLGPLILAAWQYSGAAIAAFCAGTAALELIVYLPLAARNGRAYAGVFVLLLVRTLLFALIGYVVVRLVRAQREQARSLAQANLRLAHYATTLEQLAVSRERNRLARELHDTLAHTLSAVAVQLEAARSLWDTDPGVAHDMLDQALRATRDGLEDARGAIHALRATPVEDLGLALAIRSLARSTAERADLSLEVQIPADVGNVEPAIEQAVYRIADEAMSNVVRHARARELLVRLERRDGDLELTIADDGQGFDLAQSPPQGHYGLQGMRERAAMVGGQIEFQSHPGKGTTVRLRVEGEP